MTPMWTWQTSASFTRGVARAESNPLAIVPKLDEGRDRRRVRCPLTDEELGRLLAVAEERGRRAWYRTAALAGLRKGDLERTLTADAEPVELDPIGCAVFTHDQIESVHFVASARDAADNSTTIETDLQFIDPLDPDAPHIQIISPTPASVITGPVDIVATMTDEQRDFLEWEVKIARIDTEEFRVIGQGSGEVTEGVIATFDPTLLPNDNYRIQIWANDGVHNTGIEFQYSVAGEYKLGNFTVQFTDLVELLTAQHRSVLLKVSFRPFPPPHPLRRRSPRLPFQLSWLVRTEFEKESPDKHGHGISTHESDDIIGA